MVYRPSDLASGPAILRVGRCRTLEANRVERKLSASFAADVEGYSRLMGRDEVGTLRTLTAYRVIIDRLIASHRGRIFNTAGDSLVADFASAVDAVQCAVAVQEAIAKENADRPVGEQMRFRIGRRLRRPVQRRPDPRRRFVVTNAEQPALRVNPGRRAPAGDECARQ